MKQLILLLYLVLRNYTCIKAFTSPYHLQHGAEQVYPKRIKMVVDVSGSMYRFNGHDGRLDRTMESILMVMETFGERHRNKFEVCFVTKSDSWI